MTCICVPLHCGAFVARFLLEWLHIPGLVRFERVECNARIVRVLSGVVERQIQYSVGHHLLVDILEVLEGHGEHLVVEAAVVTKIKQHLPWLHDLTDLLEVLKVRAIANHRIRWVILGRILTQQIATTDCNPEGNTLTWLYSVVLKNIGFRFSELSWMLVEGAVVLELRVDGTDVVEPVHGVVF